MGKKSESACVTLRFEGDVRVSQPHPPVQKGGANDGLLSQVARMWQVLVLCFTPQEKTVFYKSN